MISGILLVASSSILGIFVGAQLTEAFLLVPYWKKLAPNDFFKFHKTFGAKIYAFFAPLTILATVLPLLTITFYLINHSTEYLLLIVMGVATLLFFSSYFLYFKKANKKFAQKSISNSQLPNELARWENWHWGRIFFECIAFGSSLILLFKI